MNGLCCDYWYIVERGTHLSKSLLRVNHFSTCCLQFTQLFDIELSPLIPNLDAWGSIDDRRSSMEFRLTENSEAWEQALNYGTAQVLGTSDNIIHTPGPSFQVIQTLISLKRQISHTKHRSPTGGTGGGAKTIYFCSPDSL
jgi:hypothetical protein